MEEQRPSIGQHAAAISNGAVKLLSEYTGRGPTRARTTIDGDSVMILLADTLTKGERTLVEHGKNARVLQVRHDYQDAMREDLIAIVEAQVSRKVVAFMSSNHIDPDMAAEVFVLEPSPATGGAPLADHVRTSGASEG